MSLSIVHTRAALGVNAPPITVEVHISKGLPGLTMVGLPETTVKEARDRVRSAIINSGYEYPAKKITINLAPADLPKEGGRYDLPIAIALLAASEQLTANKLDEYELVGELALTGALRGVPGAISSATEAIKSGRKIIVAKDNEDEVGLINGEGCLIADHLQAVCAFLEGKHALERPKPTDAVSRALQHDLSDVIGQEQGKRGLEITAAGGHNLLLIGPPGTGKTMLASRINGLLPDLSNEEALESAAILSLVNAESVQKQWRQRPFRSPHHSASLTAMVGGGAIPGPGEISLAHNGVLFLDELPEFERRTLEFAPALFERLGWKVSLQRLNKVMFFIIALGALLPTMHQSSMGSLMISAGYKVHPLWQSYEMLPLFSLLTAFIMGFSIVIFEGSLVQAGLRGNGPDEKSLFVKLTNTISVLLAIFIVLRFGELIYRDKLSLAFAGDFYSVMFWIEVLLMLFPLVVLRVAKLRNDSRMLFLSALSALLGCATWRLTYSLVAFNPGGGYAYFPTWEELLISIGFVAIEICAYIVLIRLLPILPPLKQNDHNRHEASKA